MAGGVLLILGYLLDKKSGMSGFLDIIIGALMLIAGLALFIRPQSFEKYIHIIFAVILGVHGLNMLIEAFRGIKYKDKKILTTILMALICMGLAALVYFDPFNSNNTLMFVVGIALILDGLLLFVVSIRRGNVIHKYNLRQSEAAAAEAAAAAATAAMQEKMLAEEAKKAEEGLTFGKPKVEEPVPEPSLEFKEAELKEPEVKVEAEAVKKEASYTVDEIEEAVKAEEATAAELGNVAEAGNVAELKDGVFNASKKEEKKSLIKRFFDQE